MADKEAIAITRQVATCCCDPAKDASEKCGKVVQVVVMFISVCLGILDCYTDWNVWVGVNQNGFGLLQAPEGFVYTWLAFTIMGTILMIVSLIIDVIDLASNGNMCSSGDGWTCGFNSLTCAEVLTFLNIYLEDLPILILTFTYVLSRQISCRGYFIGNHVSEYRDIFISAVLSTAAILYRTGRSFYRLCYSYGHCCCPSREEKQRLCPTKSCARYCCIVPFGLALFCQVFLILIEIIVIALLALLLLPQTTIVAPTSFGAWNIIHPPPVASNNRTLSSVRPLIENGHLSVTEAFHRNLRETTYCLTYFELHSEEIVFNVAYITRQQGTGLSINEPCLCDTDSTPCDQYYENIFIGARIRSSISRHNFTDIRLSEQSSCPLPVKTLQRNRNLHVKCNCDFSDTVEHQLVAVVDE